MIPRRRRYHLFEAYNIGLDHMVVDRKSLEVRPAAPLAAERTLQPTAPEQPRKDVETRVGNTGHQLVVGNTKPVKRPAKWVRKFITETAELGPLLNSGELMLLPGGAHPLLKPERDATPGALWSAGTQATLNSVFNTRTHGWCNDQAVRLDLHFDRNDEFAKAHAAVRLLLPMIPALSAASPLLEGKVTGFQDSRLDSFLHAHENLPEIMGSLIPEAVFDQEDYYRQVLGPIAQALGPYDPDNLLDPQSLNARAATAHFDKGLLSINIIDAQECAGASLAIAEFVCVVLRAMVSGRWVSTYLQRAWSESDLLPMLLNTIKEGDRTVIANRDYLLMFGMMKQDEMPAIKLWQHLFVELYDDLSANARLYIGHILEHGSLASRILARTGNQPTEDKIRQVYTTLGQCLLADAALV